MLCACGILYPAKTDFGSASDVMINEVMSSNKMTLTHETLGSPDWIEIYNSGSKPVDLTGFGLSDNIRNLHKYIFPEGTVIPAGGYLLTYACDDDKTEPTGLPCIGFGLSKSGDKLYLSDLYYEILSEVEIPALKTDVSFARKSDDVFGYCDKPTPGAANDDSSIYDNPSLLYTTVDASTLVISEVDPTGTAGGPWVELYNNSNGTLSLSDFYLSDREANLTKYRLPDKEIPTGGYAVIYLDGNQTGEHEMEADFRLGKKDTALFLSGKEGNLIDQCSWEPELPEGLVIVHGEKKNSYTAYPTPGEANSEILLDSFDFSPMDASDPIRINEVLQKNKFSIVDKYGSRDSWVELYNSSDRDVSLKGYFLSDNENNLFKFPLPDIEMKAGEYLVIFLTGRGTFDGELHAPFSLGKDEFKLFLTSVTDWKTDTIELMTEPKQNVSVGRDSGGNLEYYAQPTPGSKNAKGFETADLIGFFNNEGIFVSEVSAINTTKYDWIELCNGSAEDIDLSGWYLSDSISDNTKWMLPENLVLPAGSYLAIDVTSKSSLQKEKVGTFSISANGENIVLSDREGTIRDVFDSGNLKPGISSGRIESDPYTQRVFFTEITKGKMNSPNYISGYATVPVFSDTDLYHKDAFLLEISTADENAVIRYTMDGTNPTQKSARVYSEPIRISGNTCVCAVTTEEGRFTSDIVTYTYVFEEPHDVPVVTLAIDPADFSVVCSATKSDKPERVAIFTYYEPDGSLGTSFPAGMRVKGQGTVGYRQKSFSFDLRGKYGRNSVTYPFFKDCDVTTFYSLVLRNGGQDASTTAAKMRDSYASRIVRGMNLDYAATRPVGAYINGQYWGLYDFNEELNPNYLVSHYGVDPETINFVKRNETVQKGSGAGYLQARKIGREDNLADDAKFAKYLEMVDSDYCMDYIIAQTFIINSDMFNQKFWATSDGTIKWRPVYFDLDFCLNEGSSVKRSLLPAYFSKEGIPSHNGSLTNLDVFVGLKKNAGWRKQFIERYVEILCTKFSSESLLKVFDEMVEERSAEMRRHIQRWHNPSSYDAWLEAVATFRRKVEQRPAAALQNLKDYFRLSQSEIDELVSKYSK